jgi:hypothetical protein
MIRPPAPSASPVPVSPLRSLRALCSTALSFSPSSATPRHSFCPEPRRATASIFFLFTLFRTLLHCAKGYLFSFQQNPHSLRKTPGGGAPFPAESHSPLITRHFRFRHSNSVRLPRAARGNSFAHNGLRTFSVYPDLRGVAPRGMGYPSCCQLSTVDCRLVFAPPPPSPFFRKNINPKHLSPGGLRRISFQRSYSDKPPNEAGYNDQ